MERGELNGSHTSISNLTFGQVWCLDETGNWGAFKTDDNGNGAWDLNQSRTSNDVNEITDITETAGPSWVTPAYTAAGNMTTMPQPASPTSSYTATYDAWNRLVKIADASNTVSEYQYDGAKRRAIQKAYVGGTLDETRHLYYTQPSRWQVVEERVDSATDPDRQFVWGLRYVDDLVLRDRDTTGNGTLDERLYGLQDANWNVTAVVDTSGSVQQRFNYDAYGMPAFLTAGFASSTNTKGLEVLYCGYRFENATTLFHVRNRVLQVALGCWVQRDPVGYVDGPHLFTYCSSSPTTLTDSAGLFLPAGAALNPATVAACLAIPACAVLLGAGAAIGGAILIYKLVRITETVCLSISKAIVGVLAICEFYDAWCKWGNVCGHPPEWRPDGNRAPCGKCFATCVARGGSWDFLNCPMGNHTGGPPQVTHSDPVEPTYPC